MTNSYEAVCKCCFNESYKYLKVKSLKNTEVFWKRNLCIDFSFVALNEILYW